MICLCQLISWWWSLTGPVSHTFLLQLRGLMSCLLLWIVVRLVVQGAASVFRHLTQWHGRSLEATIQSCCLMSSPNFLFSWSHFLIFPSPTLWCTVSLYHLFSVIFFLSEYLSDSHTSLYFPHQCLLILKTPKAKQFTNNKKMYITGIVGVTQHKVLGNFNILFQSLYLCLDLFDTTFQHIN